MDITQTKTERHQAMYGVPDLDEFIESITQTITYQATGANMVIAGLMSDAQEEMAHGNSEGARQTLNRAKAVLFRVMNGNLRGSVQRGA
jgi:hypothetical protein